MKKRPGITADRITRTEGASGRQLKAQEFTKTSQL